MCFSALQILVFHLWVTVFRGNAAEAFLIKTSYIGVDIFFFLSAYTLSQRYITDLKGYYLSRFTNVYLKFVLFAILAIFASSYTFMQVLKIVSFVELFQKGGGAFLWFLPAIVLFYVIYPFIQRVAKKNPVVVTTVALALWLIIGVLVTKFTGYKRMFIFFNRIPVIVLGCICGKYHESIKQCFDGTKGKLLKAGIGIALCTVGTFLLWKFGYKAKLSSPIYDLYYITAIPSSIGLVMLIDFIPENRVIKQIGSATLEMYALQMIFGFKFATMVYKAFQNAMYTNITVIVTITLASVILSVVYKAIYKKIK